MPRILLRPLAVRDLDAHSAFIARTQRAAARRFVRVTEKALTRLALNPALGPVWDSQDPRLTGLRCWTLRGFPNHVIFYRAVADGIEVVRILHGAQDLNRIIGDL
jgi:toxin ParE1/3/4